MSDHRERACHHCGSLLHHEDKCAERPGTANWLHIHGMDEDAEQQLKTYAEQHGLDYGADLPWFPGGTT